MPDPSRLLRQRSWHVVRNVRLSQFFVGCLHDGVHVVVSCHGALPELLCSSVHGLPSMFFVHGVERRLVCVAFLQVFVLSLDAVPSGVVSGFRRLHFGGRLGNLEVLFPVFELVVLRSLGVLTLQERPVGTHGVPFPASIREGDSQLVANRAKGLFWRGVHA